jgi:hypothetical protein
MLYFKLGNEKIKIKGYNRVYLIYDLAFYALIPTFKLHLKKKSV